MAFSNLSNVDSDAKLDLFPPAYAATVARFAKIVDSIELNNFPIKIKLLLLPDRKCYESVELRVMSIVSDRDTGRPTDVAQANMFSIHEIDSMSHDACVYFIYSAISHLVQHELSECFTVDGKRIYDPHADVVFVKHSKVV